jgi:hypothetical protein
MSAVFCATLTLSSSEIRAMVFQMGMVSRGCLLLGLVFGLSGFSSEPTAPPAAVQTVCMAAGERTSGMNKICYYDCLGSTRAVTQSAVSLCPLSINAPGPAPMTAPRPPVVPRPGQTTCFARGEQASGMNKICYYDCLGSARAITQSAVSLCPLTIQQ